MKILMIGNSHVGAVIKAFKDDPDIADLHFLAMDGNSLLQNLQITERCELQSGARHVVEAIEAQGLAGVSLNTFDCLIVYGCQLRAAGSGEHWIMKITDPMDGYSAQVRKAALTDFVHDTAHYRFMKELATWPLKEGMKIISMPSPLPNVLAPFCEDLPEVDKRYLQETHDFIRREIEQLGIDYLDTPDSLLADNRITTREEFKATWKNDTAHLNTKGGGEVLATITGYLQAA